MPKTTTGGHAGGAGRRVAKFRRRARFHALVLLPPGRGAREHVARRGLEADELAAVAADLEAAKSGAADGAWALATWAPAGFADAEGV